MVKSSKMNSTLDALDWNEIEKSIFEFGYAKTPSILSAKQCGELIQLYADARLFRSVVDMERFRFGIGEYKYFADPLPALIRDMREEAYACLAPIANRWMQALGAAQRYPETLESFLDECALHGQTRPTPLILRYEAGGYNCLHQDLYGSVAFPFQLTIFLSRRNIDYTGGQFLLVEQPPRAQSKGEVIDPDQGEILTFTNRYRPARGAHGFYRVNVKHGISRVTSGTRYALGIIFHNAK